MTRPSRDELLDLYERQGLTLRAMGAHYGVSRMMVQRWMRALDIPRRPGPGSVRRYDHDAIRRLHAAGLTKGQIAYKIGCSRQAVDFVMRKAAA